VCLQNLHGLRLFGAAYLTKQIAEHIPNRGKLEFLQTGTFPSSATEERKGPAKGKRALVPIGVSLPEENPPAILFPSLCDLVITTANSVSLSLLREIALLPKLKSLALMRLSLDQVPIEKRHRETQRDSDSEARERKRDSEADGRGGRRVKR
jgi:hypothetical protein